MNHRPSLTARAALLSLVLTLAAAVVPAQNLSQGGGSLRLMSYNVFAGTDYAPILGATDLGSFVIGVGGVLAEVRASQPHARMQAVARQIAVAAPTVVSLQEVNRWRSGSYDLVSQQCGTMSIEYDLLQDLLDDLAAQGASYTAAVKVTQFSIGALLGQLPSGELVCVGVEDRNALLVRTDLVKLQWQNPQSGNFSNALVVPTPVGTVRLPNGWMSLDITFFNKKFRMFGAHLAVLPVLRRLQGVELRAMADSSPLPLALAMDSNAQASPAPLDATYADFVADGYVDGWSVAEPALLGFTCCQSSLDTATSQLVQRVDLVLTRGEALQAQNGALFGITPASKTASGLWPSDHAGVTLQYSLEPTH